MASLFFVLVICAAAAHKKVMHENIPRSCIHMMSDTLVDQLNVDCPPLFVCLQLAPDNFAKGCRQRLVSTSQFCA